MRWSSGRARSRTPPGAARERRVPLAVEEEGILTISSWEDALVQTWHGDDGERLAAELVGRADPDAAVTRWGGQRGRREVGLEGREHLPFARPCAHSVVTILHSNRCALTLQRMSEPVQCSLDGRVYERSAIEAWFSQHGYRPADSNDFTFMPTALSP